MLIHEAEVEFLPTKTVVYQLFQKQFFPYRATLKKQKLERNDLREYHSSCQKRVKCTANKTVRY
jgi:hypothetical protein